MRRPAALLASTSVSQRLVLALVLGAAGGAVLGHRAEALRPLADLLLLLLKAFAVPAVVVPAVVVSILHGLAGGSLRQLGGLGLRLVAAYGATAVLATAIGAASAMLMLGGPRGGGGRLASESGRPPGAEERVFEKFYRGGSTQQGFGLGLPIAKAVVTAHGGTITAANRRPRGVAVRFELPAAEPPPPPEDERDRP